MADYLIWVCYHFNIGFVSHWPRCAAPLSSLLSCNFGSLLLCWMCFQASSCLCHPAAMLKGCLSLYCKLKLSCFVFATSVRMFAIMVHSAEYTRGLFVLIHEVPIWCRDTLDSSGSHITAWSDSHVRLRYFVKSKGKALIWNLAKKFTSNTFISIVATHTTTTSSTFLILATYSIVLVLLLLLLVVLNSFAVNILPSTLCKGKCYKPTDTLTLSNAMTAQHKSWSTFSCHHPTAPGH